MNMIEQKGKCVRRDDPGSSAVVNSGAVPRRAAARAANHCAPWRQAYLESAPLRQAYLESGWNRYAPAMSKSCGFRGLVAS